MILPHRDNVKTVAVLHQQEASCRVLVASIRSGAGTGDYDIKAAETLHLGSGGSGFTAMIERLGGVDAVVRVLPPGCTIARVCPLPSAPESAGDASGPGGSNAALADALEIMAETDLPAAVPAYRRSAGLISPGRARKPVGLLTAWPSGGGTELDPATRTPRVAPEVGISEAAALAVLAQLIGGVDRAWTIDRASGAMTILAAGPEKTIVRVARIPAGEPGADARRTAIVETSRAAGLIAPDANPSSDSGWLTIEPTPASPRIAGQPRSADWLAHYGLAAAALAAFADPNPAVSALVALHESEPKAKPPILQRVSEFFGAPRLAVPLIVVCVLVFLALPIGVSYAKYRLFDKQVKAQVGDIQKLYDQNDKDERELAFYKLLHDRRWPMTKLLADIAGCCPQGISVEAVEIGQGDGISLRGSADDTSKLTTFRANLNNSKVFADATTPTVNPTATGVVFTLTAKVTSNGAIYPAKPADDWAASSLADRLYPGQHAAPRAHSSTAPRSDRSDRPERSTSRSDRRSTTSSRSSASSSRESSRDRSTSAPAAKQSTAIPPPISDADIAKLSRDDAMKEWANRKRVAVQPGIDEAVKQRLLDESEKARTRMTQTSGGGQ